MSRKTKIVKVPEGFGRDASKVFLLTEWDADRAETWALRAILAFNRGGGDFGFEAVIGGGMEAIFFLGMQTFLRGQMRAEELKPILDELLTCVQMIRDPAATHAETGQPVVTPIVSPDDIEEVKTRLWLRSEVLELHTGFSAAGALSTLVEAIMAPRASPNTPTSPP